MGGWGRLFLLPTARSRPTLLADSPGGNEIAVVLLFELESRRFEGRKMSHSMLFGAVVRGALS